jgi:hypothetical protein
MNDTTKLPKWAQSLLQQKHQSIQSLQKKIQEFTGPPRSRGVFVRDHSTTPYRELSLPPGTVHFRVSDDWEENIEISQEETGGTPFLVIRTVTSQMTVHPRSSNTIHVYNG